MKDFTGKYDNGTNEAFIGVNGYFYLKTDHTKNVDVYKDFMDLLQNAGLDCSNIGKVEVVIRDSDYNDLTAKETF